MKDFCQSLHQKYCMNDESFTEMDYVRTVEEMLFYCVEVDRLRLNLPFQLVGHHCNAATMILANTLKAFATRPEEDSAKLRTLVLENITDIAIGSLWMNPVDVMNIKSVFEGLEHLVMTIRRHLNDPIRARWFGSCLWNWLDTAERLESLCLIGVENDDRPPRGLKQTKFWQIPVDEWRTRSLPAPHVILPYLTCLELKRVDVDPDVFTKISENFGPTLQELYLNEVYLKTEQGRDWNEDSRKVLWIGMPNQRAPVDSSWVAMALRTGTPQLRICRSSFLGYDHYLRDEASAHPEFDHIDPCGLGRSVSQRFVEVVMGIQQPNMPSGEPVEYMAPDAKHDRLARQLTARSKPLSVTEYDTNAHQTAVANTTSAWQKSIDGVFPNCNSNTLDELHHIAETACQGMNEIHRRRSEWTAGNSTANEYTDNLFSLPRVEDEPELGPDAE